MDINHRPQKNTSSSVHLSGAESKSSQINLSDYQTQDFQDRSQDLFGWIE